MSVPNWIPAEQQVPHLLPDLMHMGTVRHGDHNIEQYKHIDTRRYLNLDGVGQAWEIAVDRDTGEVNARRIDAADALARLEGRSEGDHL